MPRKKRSERAIPMPMRSHEHVQMQMEARPDWVPIILDLVVETTIYATTDWDE